jgi:hypothetical protein
VRAHALAATPTLCAGARDIMRRLVGSYCRAAGGLMQALAGVGPLREALLLAAEVRGRLCAGVRAHR